MLHLLWVKAGTHSNSIGALHGEYSFPCDKNTFTRPGAERGGTRQESTFGAIRCVGDACGYAKGPGESNYFVFRNFGRLAYTGEER